MPADPTDRLPAIQQAVAAREHEYIGLLKDLVNIDSGSLDRDGVRRITDVLEGILLAEGYAVERHPAGELDVLVGRRGGTGPTILLSAHMDTVFASGTAAQRPFSIDDGTAHGPGVADDKCGIVAALVATQALLAAGGDPDVMLVLTPDEELGSPDSAEVTKALAKEADVALCLEAARASGALVSSRKGGANMDVVFTGRAAHSGVEPEKGINAALQMAHAIIDLQALNDLERGVTVNAGVARAGTRSNIIAAEATLRVDLRAATVQDHEQLLADVDRILHTEYVDGVRVAATTGAEAPPMEATPGTLALARAAVDLAATLGFDLDHVDTGGLGDANLMATAGIPVLDGLAPIGGDDHTPEEWLDVASIVPRLTLLAGLMDLISAHGVPDG